ncbi:MAG: thioesterase family protein [Pseudomonadota bacterium]
MKLPLYQGYYQIKLKDTDTAGVVYFGQIYEIVHGVYESFMQFASLPLTDLLATKHYHLPIIHSEADYKQAMRLGENIEIQLFLEKTSVYTFTLSYLLYNPKQVLLANAKTVHIAIDKTTHYKIPLPDEISQLFI